MLGLFVIYFIGKSYFGLAAEHDRNRWVFAILGVGTYYAGTFLFGILLGITFELFSPGTIDGMNDIVLGLMALPGGILATVGLYYLLKHIWEGNRKDAREHLDPKKI